MNKSHLLAIALLVPALALAEGTKNKVLVKQGNTVITQDDVRHSAATYGPKEAQAQLFGDEKKLRNFIAQMFSYWKLGEEGKALKLTPEEEFQVKDAQLRAFSKIVLERAVNAPPQPDFDKLAQETFKANPERFQEPERVRVQHVLISTKTRPDAEAKARADEVLAKAKAGTSMETLAAEYSDDPSAERNKGDLGQFTRGRMVKPFEEAAFALQKEGDIAGPVKTDFGYHIIRLVEHKAAGTVPFESVKAKLVDEERTKFRKERVMAAYERVGKLPGIESDQDAIMELYSARPMPTEPEISKKGKTSAPAKK